MSLDRIDWIAADWGTSNLRCWAMSPEDEVLFHSESNRGMSRVAAEDGDFESALLELIDPWLRDNETIPVFACGMVGAKQGWIEVPYSKAPCSPKTERIEASSKSDRIFVTIHAGIKQLDPADVMRGEETQISGLLALHSEFEGLVCLPGTHTKWVTVSHGEIRSFQTFMTGELFSLLSERSVLRLTISESGWDEAAFLDGVKESRQTPELLFNNCFRLRAKSLLSNLDGIEARSRLSGLLIGHELSGALGEESSRLDVVLVGSDRLTSAYQSALASLKIESQIISNEKAILAGLSRGRR